MGFLGVILGSVRIVGIAPRKIVGIDDAGLVVRDVGTIAALISRARGSPPLAAARGR